MASLSERIEADYKTAYKSGARVRIDTLRLLKAGMQKVAIDKRKDKLEDAEIIQVLSQQVKQRRETLESAKTSNRQDILVQTEEELAILNTYLPAALGAEQIKSLIDEAIRTAGTNQGQIMKFVMAKAAGTVDGKLVSQLVAERLRATQA